MLLEQPPDLNAALARAASGEHAAYAAVVRHYERPLAGFLARMGLPAARVEELAQDAFVRAWVHLGQYRAERAQFSTWLYTLARRLALNAIDRSAQRLEVPTSDALAEVNAASTDTLDPLNDLLRRRRAAQVQVALRTLPAGDRSVLALAYVSELDIAQIAHIEGCSLGAVRTRLYRARERLRAALGELEGSP